MIRSTLALAALLLASTPILADGRADWRDYAWQKIDIATCRPDGGALTCPLYHQKWDWKRDQWVDILVRMDAGSGELRLTQRLTDNERSDDDYVCVTAILVDAAGRNLVAHHQNWHMDPGQVEEMSFLYRSAALSSAATLHIGSKQCREGAGQDDAVYAAVLSAIQP